MANNLSSAVRAALTGPRVDGSIMSWKVTLVEQGIDITDRVEDWGSSTLKAANWNPRRKGRIDLPQNEMTFINEDHVFEDDSPSSIWGAYESSQTTLRVDIFITPPGASAENLGPFLWRVIDVDCDGDYARVVCTHALTSTLDRAFGDDHVHELKNLEPDGGLLQVDGTGPS